MRFGKKNGAAADEQADAPQSNQGSTDSAAASTGDADASIDSTEKSDPSEPSKESEPTTTVTTDPAPSGDRVPLKAPAGASSCAIDGLEYAVVDGLVHVHERHVAQLREIGFSWAGE